MTNEEEKDVDNSRETCDRWMIKVEGVKRREEVTRNQKRWVMTNRSRVRRNELIYYTRKKFIQVSRIESLINHRTPHTRICTRWPQSIWQKKLSQQCVKHFQHEIEYENKNRKQRQETKAKTIKSKTGRSGKDEKDKRMNWERRERRGYQMACGYHPKRWWLHSTIKWNIKFRS